MLSLLAVAACSGDTVRLDDYRRRVAALFDGYNEDIRQLASGLTTSGTREEVFASLAAYAGAGVDRTAGLLADWDALAVPKRARSVHAQGRDVINGYQQAFADLRAGAEAQEEGARLAFNQALEQDLPQRLQQFQQALNALQ